MWTVQRALSIYYAVGLTFFCTDPKSDPSECRWPMAATRHDGPRSFHLGIGIRRFIILSFMFLHHIHRRAYAYRECMISCLRTSLCSFLATQNSTKIIATTTKIWKYPTRNTFELQFLLSFYCAAGPRCDSAKLMAFWWGSGYSLYNTTTAVAHAPV